jgi:hypothetical protein
MPSDLSVSDSPERRLRLWCSSGSLRISPLHPEFRAPLLPSSHPVSQAIARLSRAFSPLTQMTAYIRFTPSNSG